MKRKTRLKILIVGGHKKTDFLLGSLLDKEHRVTLIHDDEEFCKSMARKHDATVIWGDGSKPYMLEDAEAEEMDIVIAMTPEDPDNLVICQLAKKVYGVKRVFSTVSNPKNVEVFKKLGVDVAISATYVITKVIEQMVTIDEMAHFIPIENGNIVMMETVIRADSPICNKTLSEADIPDDAVIGCIVRGFDIVIPKGKTKVLENDKLIIISLPEAQEEIIDSVVGR